MMAAAPFLTADIPESVLSLPPRLANDAEVQKLLSDERMRAEQHRMNYLMLKTEHSRLQDEYAALQSDIKRSLDDKRSVQENSRLAVEQLKAELDAKRQECEELRAQLWTPQRMEMVRLQLREEVEKVYRERLAAAESDTEAHRLACSQLKYDFTFLKSEYEHETQLHRQVVDELKQKYEAEISNLRADRESVAQKSHTESNQDSLKVKAAQREIAQLQMRIKALVAEVEDLRAQKEHTVSQSGLTTSMYTKQLADQASSIKAIEMERDSLRSQVASLQRELATNVESVNELTAQVHEYTTDNAALRSRLEEVTHRTKVEVANVRVELMRDHSNTERACDRLRSELDDRVADIDSLKKKVDQLEKELLDKERDAAKREQLAREQEMEKLAQIEDEKNTLATRLQEVERRKLDESSQRQLEKERADDVMQKMKEAKDTAEKEAAIARAKLDSQTALQERLDKERSENASLKSHLSRVEVQYQQYLSGERDLLDANEALRDEVEKMKRALQDKQNEVAQAVEVNETTMIQMRANFAEERVVLQRRIDELDTELAIQQTKIADVFALHSRKKKKMAKLIVKLKHKTEHQAAKINEMEVEREALKKYVPRDVHFMMQKQLKDLVRRHQTFRGVILTPDPTAAVGELSVNAQDVTEIEQPDSKLALLKDRMEILDNMQRRQMQELQEAMRSAGTKNYDNKLDSEL